jgi:hypothetical protein
MVIVFQNDALSNTITSLEAVFQPGAAVVMSWLCLSRRSRLTLRYPIEEGNL